MAGRFGIGKWIATAVALLFACAGVFFLVEAARYKARVLRAREHRPVDIAVDFSKPGEYRSGLRQTFANSHGEWIGLALPRGTLESRDVAALLAGLSGEYRILGGDSDSPVRSGVLSLPDRASPLPGFVELAYFNPFRSGEYEIVVMVAEGAPGLEGIDQRLQARYFMCGAEMLPAAVPMYLGVAVLFIAAIIGLVVFLLARRQPKAEEPDARPGAGASDAPRQ